MSPIPSSEAFLSIFFNGSYFRLKNLFGMYLAPLRSYILAHSALHPYLFVFWCCRMDRFCNLALPVFHLVVVLEYHLKTVDQSRILISSFHFPLTIFGGRFLYKGGGIFFVTFSAFKEDKHEVNQPDISWVGPITRNSQRFHIIQPITANFQFR